MTEPVTPIVWCIVKCNWL